MPSILPPYMRVDRDVAAIFYLNGISTGDFVEALDAAGLSASAIGR